MSVEHLPAIPDEEKDKAPATREGIAAFQVSGKDPALWAKLRGKFLVKIEKLVELVNSDDTAVVWAREQAKELRDGALDYVKAKLRKEGVEVERIEADVAKLFGEAEKARAEAFKTHEEGLKVREERRALAIDNYVSELRIQIGIQKALLIGEKGREAVLFGRQLDAMLEAIKLVADEAGGK